MATRAECIAAAEAVGWEASKANLLTLSPAIGPISPADSEVLIPALYAAGLVDIRAQCDWEAGKVIQDAWGITIGAEGYSEAMGLHGSLSFTLWFIELEPHIGVVDGLTQAVYDAVVGPWFEHLGLD